MNEQNQWYVTIEGNAVGPVSTDLVVRGIKHKKIATNAFVCVVGASEWQSLLEVAEFYEALADGGLLEPVVHRNGHHHDVEGIEMASSTLPADTEIDAAGPLKDADDGEEADTTASFSSKRTHELATATHQQEAAAQERPPVGDTSELEPRNGTQADLMHWGRPKFPSVDLDIDITVDYSQESSIDWGRGFSAYFLVDSEVKLPDEQQLLHSLSSVPHDTFLHDEAMWNLALCLAFGSDAVATAAASVFFDVVTAHELHDRIEWMSRTLLSRGFMPSGIPHDAGYRGLSHLQSVCPPGLQPKLEREIAS